MTRGIGWDACVTVIALVALTLTVVPRNAAGFSLSSSSFPSNGDIPQKHTCDGAGTDKQNPGDMSVGVSPALTWQDPPPGTKAFALILDDPDRPSGSYIHWLLFDIPAGTRELPEGIPKSETLPDGSRHGRNDFRNPFYQAPCPPRGEVRHHYVFTLYALDAPTGLPAGTSKPQLMLVIQKHTLATAALTGLFGR